MGPNPISAIAASFHNSVQTLVSNYGMLLQGMAQDLASRESLLKTKQAEIDRLSANHQSLMLEMAELRKELHRALHSNGSDDVSITAADG